MMSITLAAEKWELEQRGSLKRGAFLNISQVRENSNSCRTHEKNRHFLITIGYRNYIIKEPIQ